MQPIEIISEGQKLEGNIFYPELLKTKTPAILFIHGWTSSRRSSRAYAEAFRDLGFICLTFDMKGHGESSADIKTLSRTNFLNDVLAAFDYLVTQNSVDQEKVYVVGSSFGGYMATLLATKRKVKSICMRVPANYNDEDFELPWTNKRYDENGSIALKALSDFTGRVLIVESENDEMVSRETVENYKKAVKNGSQLTYEVMLGAPHRLSDDPIRMAEFIKILKDWFKTA